MLICDDSYSSFLQLEKLVCAWYRYWTLYGFVVISIRLYIYLFYRIVLWPQVAGISWCVSVVLCLDWVFYICSFQFKSTFPPSSFCDVTGYNKLPVNTKYKCCLGMLFGILYVISMEKILSVFTATLFSLHHWVRFTQSEVSLDSNSSTVLA